MNTLRFKATTRYIEQTGVLKLQILEDNHLLAIRQIINYWINNRAFKQFFCSLFSDAGFEWYVWEMPPITRNNLAAPFECVLVQIPPRPRRPDRRSFATYFDPNGDNHGIVTFANLSRDALLVVPSPIRPEDEYIELANFLTQASEQQVHALWRVLGQSIMKRLNDQPLWVSVAGGGVAWLHLRLDTYPKYYRYREYARSSGSEDNSPEFR